MYNFRCWTLCAMLTCLLSAPVCYAQDATNQRLRRHALLVGCSDYENLDEFFQLRGPVNDVQLMRQMLIDRFEFDPKRDDIVILAASEPTDHQPTRSNIEREFQRLGESVKSQEPVVILLAGHGSQQPDNDPDNREDIESDGMDEIFLPCDVGKWNGDTGTIQNAIVDDDLRSWLGAIVSKGASVWVIMDACHSGSGVRGSSAEVSRQVPPESLIPEGALSLAESRIAVAESEPRESLFDGSGEWVAIYAAQPHETTPERKLPAGAAPDARKYYGLLTYTIAEILSNTSRTLTYNELVQAVQTRYIRMGRRSPTPLIEGSQRDTVVLGRDSFPERSRMLLINARSKPLSVSLGALHEITKGSILAVYPPVGAESADPDQPLGHVKVTRVEMTSSEVEPCEFGKMISPARTTLSNRSRCEIVFRDFGDLRLSVTVDDKDSDGETLDEAAREKLMTALRDQKSDLVSVVDQTEDAEWLLRYGQREVQLVPAEGVSQEDQAGLPPSLASRTLSGGWANKVIGDLERIARARNLLRITDATSEKPRGGGLGFRLTVLDQEGEPIGWQSDGRTLEDGQQVTVVMENAGQQSLDVTLLYVDSAYGIDCLFPKVFENNRLGPGDKQSISLTINADTAGLENIVAIVVKADRQPVDFSLLKQPSLAQAEQSRGGGGALETPLGQLCRSALFGKGNMRGVSRTDTQNYDIQVLSWRILRKN